MDMSDYTLEAEPTLEKINLLFDLAHLLRHVKDDSFDMTTWVGWKEKRVDSPDRPIHCQTVACIGGWATTIHPELSLCSGSLGCGLFLGLSAFVHAFGIDVAVADALTKPRASHSTPKKASVAVEQVAIAYAEKMGYDIVEYQKDVPEFAQEQTMTTKAYTDEELDRIAPEMLNGKRPDRDYQLVQDIKNADDLHVALIQAEAAAVRALDDEEAQMEARR